MQQLLHYIPNDSILKRMKNLLLLLFVSTLFTTSYSQITFESGYFIDNNNNKVDCLIKNVDWKNNPESIQYKLSEKSDVKTAGVQTIKEFNIYDGANYVRADVGIDRSSNNINYLDDDVLPKFTNEQLFLKLLVDGEATLYSYEDESIIRYFYKLNSSAIEQLIFKKYKNKYGKIGRNERFRQQLWNDLKCEDLSRSKLAKLLYNRRELTDVFVTYNKCKDATYTGKKTKSKKDLFNLSIKPGINSSKLEIENVLVPSRNSVFSNEITFSLGLEAEVLLPFNKNKWAIFVEPTYTYYEGESEYYGEYGQTVKTDYKSVEIPIGLRHYFFLNENSKLFLNASLVFNIDLDSGINRVKDDYRLWEINTRNNAMIGLGYKLKDTYSLEFRYHSSREVLGTYSYWNSDYQKVSLVFGYTFL